MFSTSATADCIRAAAESAETSPLGVVGQLLLGELADPGHAGARHTLLAVCPNSEAVTRAALQAAQEVETPLLYAATLNQIDRDGGYTGWTPSAFARFVARERQRFGVEVPVFLGLDHGGPWAKDRHVAEDLTERAAMDAAKQSIAACVDAGYDLLHLDPAAGPPQEDRPLEIDTLVERTVALARPAEKVREDLDRARIGYEVGTDAPRGGLTTEGRLQPFLARLGDALRSGALPDPSFVVADLGTRLGSEQFDANRAEAFVRVAQAEAGALLKGHYTDDVAEPEVYPLAGVGGANVGPGLSSVEVGALRDLLVLEERLGKQSGFEKALRAAVVESGRWRKWLPPDEQDRSFDTLSDERQRWLVDTGSRYVWTSPEVREARTQLYNHVAPYRDASAFVEWRLKTAILRYMHAFNLVGLCDRIREGLASETS